jgi:hypothetical protein
MTQVALKNKVKQLHKALDEENISYGEIVELDSIAEELGITSTDEMMAVDVLIEVEDKLGI